MADSTGQNTQGSNLKNDVSNAASGIKSAGKAAAAAGSGNYVKAGVEAAQATKKLGPLIFKYVVLPVIFLFAAIGYLFNPRQIFYSVQAYWNNITSYVKETRTTKTTGVNAFDYSLFGQLTEGAETIGQITNDGIKKIGKEAINLFFPNKSEDKTQGGYDKELDEDSNLDELGYGDDASQLDPAMKNRIEAVKRRVNARAMEMELSLSKDQLLKWFENKIGLNIDRSKLTSNWEKKTSDNANTVMMSTLKDYAAAEILAAYSIQKNEAESSDLDDASIENVNGKQVAKSRADSLADFLEWVGYQDESVISMLMGHYDYPWKGTFLPQQIAEMYEEDKYHCDELKDDISDIKKEIKELEKDKEKNKSRIKAKKDEIKRAKKTIETYNKRIEKYESYQTALLNYVITVTKPNYNVSYTYYDADGNIVDGPTEGDDGSLNFGSAVKTEVEVSYTSGMEFASDETIARIMGFWSGDEDGDLPEENELKKYSYDPELAKQDEEYINKGNGETGEDDDDLEDADDGTNNPTVDEVEFGDENDAAAQEALSQTNHIPTYSGDVVTFNGNSVKVLKQKKSSNANIRPHGCGVSSTAFALTLLGKKVSPIDVQNKALSLWGKWPSKGGLPSGRGIETLIKSYGYSATYYPVSRRGLPATKKTIDSALKAGNMVICWTSGKRHSGDPFAGRGMHHYVLAVGYDRNGKIVVANSGGKGPVNVVSLSTLCKYLQYGNGKDKKWWYSYKKSAGIIVVGSGTGTTATLSSMSGDITKQDLGIFSPLTADDINRFINKKLPSGIYGNTGKKCPWVGRGDIFIKASEESGLDPRFIVSIAAFESAYGTSKIATDKYNYFGINARDWAPYASATNFSSGDYGDAVTNGVVNGAKWIREHYYNQNERNLHDMIYGGKEYSTAKDDWINGIAKIMKTLPANTSASFAGGNGQEIIDADYNVFDVDAYFESKSDYYNKDYGYNDELIENMKEALKWGRDEDGRLVKAYDRLDGKPVEDNEEKKKDDEKDDQRVANGLIEEEESTEPEEIGTEDAVQNTIYKTTDKVWARNDDFQFQYFLDMMEYMSDYFDISAVNDVSDGSSIVQIAQQELAAAESDDNCLHGYKYKEAAGLGRNDPWCCAFVYWCGDQLGCVGDGCFGPRTAACQTAWEWFSSQGVTHMAKSGYTPGPGDLIFYYSVGATSGASHHIGIVESCDGENVTTIEGNTTGHQLRRRTHEMSNPRILGYATPEYPASADMTNIDIGDANSLQEYFWLYGLSQGYKPVEIAGIMGNIYQECSSGVKGSETAVRNAIMSNKEKWNCSTVGHHVGNYGSATDLGIVQWTDNGECSHYTRLINYCKDKNLDPKDGKVQTQYLFYQISGNCPSKYVDNIWRKIGPEMKAAALKTPSEAALWWEKHFERAGIKMKNNRIYAAKAYYEKFKNVTAISSSSNGSASGAKIVSTAKDVAKKLSRVVNYHDNTGKRIRPTTLDTALKNKAINCNVYVSIVLQEAGVLKKGQKIGHTTPGQKGSLNKAMKGIKYLDKSKIHYLGKNGKRYDKLPSMYKQPGCVYIWDSNIGINVGGKNKKEVIYSFSHGPKNGYAPKQARKYKYNSYNFSHGILVVITP